MGYLRAFLGKTSEEVVDHFCSSAASSRTVLREAGESHEDETRRGNPPLQAQASSQ